MRNLKRALSLGLTAAMISGLMVMGSSAASYADVTSENNVEAIEVLEAVGIMIGDESGNFNPDQNVTRNEMAVVMANLMEYNVASYKDTSPFTDVPSWAEPYVAACWTNGITAGYSDTIYGGSDTVTTAQAALMLMKALGYFQYASDFGGDWQLATTRQGNAIDLFNGVDSGVTQPMTRNDVAQLVLNTLRAGTVQASTDGSWSIGDVTINNNVTYNYITSNADYAMAIDDTQSTDANTDAGRSIVELGEQLYQGDLQLNDSTHDVFGRPARYWEYDGDEIGTYAKTELLKQSYTTEVTGRDLYDLLGSSTIREYSFNISVDGETEEDVLGDAYFDEGNLIRSNTKGVGDTGDGVLTEVYVDVIDKTVDIAVINTYLAKAVDDYDERNDEATYAVWSIEDKGRDNLVKTLPDGDEVITTDLTVNGDDFAIEDVAKDDIVLVRVADGEIQEMIAPEVLDGVEISAFRTGHYVTVDGTQYDYADSIQYDEDVLDEYDHPNMKDTTYNVYLDPYGYAIGVEIVDEQNNYVFLTGMDSSNSNLANRNLDANVIFLDGTMDTVTVDSSDSEFYSELGALMNTWCIYTVDNNGVYTLTEVATNNNQFAAQKEDVGQGENVDYSNVVDDELVTLDKSHITLDGFKEAGEAYYRVYANDDTVFLSAETDVIHAKNPDALAVIVSDVNTVTTGIQNVNLKAWNAAAVQDDDADYANVALANISNGVHTLFDDDGYVIAAVVIGEDDGAAVNYAFATTSSMNREAYDKNNDEYTWTREAIVNGEVVTLTEIGDTKPEIEEMEQGQWYEVRYDVNGNVRRVDALSNAPTGMTVPAMDFDGYYTENNAAPDGEWLGDKYIQSISDVEDATNDKNNVLLWDNLTGNNYEISVVGSTLQVENATTGEHMAFAVTSDATTALVQDSVTNTGKVTYIDDIYEYTGGSSGLERAVRNLNDNDAFRGYVGAVFTNGIATSVVIYDQTATYINTGDNIRPDNMVENGNVQLWGMDNTLRVNGVSSNWYTDTVTFTFYAMDGENVRRNANVEYDIDVLVNNQLVFSDDDVQATSNGAGLVSDDVSPVSADDSDDVVVRISNVTLVGGEVEGFYLTLMGDYADATAVYANRGSALTGAPITGDYGATVGYRYGPFAAGTEITVADSSITVADGVYTVDGVEVTVDQSANRLTFDITADTTLQTAPVAGNARYTVTASDGITLYDEDGNKLTSTVAVTAGTDLIVESETGTYFTKAAGEDSKAISGSPTSDSTALDVTGNLIVYAATQVNLNNVVATYDRADGAQNVPTGRYVAMGTDLTVAPVANQGTGVIVGTTFGDDLNGTYTVGDTAVTLSAAVELTLNEGVSAVLKSDNTPVASGKYVKAGESNLLTITVDSDYGTSAIDLAQAGGLKHVDSSDAITGNMSTSTEDIDLYAAAQVNLEGTVANLYYVGTRNNITVADESYIISGVTLYSADATSVAQVDGGTVDYTTSEGELTFVTSNEDVNITNV